MNLPKDPAGSGEPGEGLAPRDSNSWPRICPHPKHPKPAGSAPFPNKEFGSFPGFPGKSGSCPGSGESAMAAPKDSNSCLQFFVPKPPGSAPFRVLGIFPGSREPSRAGNQDGLGLGWIGRSWRGWGQRWILTLEFCGMGDVGSQGSSHSSMSHLFDPNSIPSAFPAHSQPIPSPFHSQLRSCPFIPSKICSLAFLAFQTRAGTHFSPGFGKSRHPDIPNPEIAVPAGPRGWDVANPGGRWHRGTGSIPGLGEKRG